MSAPASVSPLQITFPEALPVSARRDEIAAALQQHQVIIVCGETGSGKTTQLPKIALALGLTQTLRGAHFPSHTLWTALVCWGVALANHQVFRWVRRA